MKYIVVVLVAALLIASAFALDDQLKVSIQDHTAQIFATNDMPTTVTTSQFSDFAALALGQSPLNQDSPVPMTNALKRAQASVTVITMDRLPNVSTPMTLDATNKSQTQSGALVQAVTGANKCLLGSQSLMGQIYTSNVDSMVFAFSSQSSFANNLCASLPTTGPATTVGKAICATLDEFVGATDVAFSSPESNSAIAQAVALTKSTDFTLLQSQFGVVVTGADITINGVVYPRTEAQVETILKELTYITNVSSSLSSFGTIVSDSAVDAYTFVISSTDGIQNNAELIGLVEKVAQKTIDNFATAYSQNIISQLISAPSQLNSNSLCITGLGGEAPIGVGATEGAVSTEQIRSYQITLWISIALIATAVVGFASTATMHLFPDPAIQGGQSTYWVHKK